jgi:hypothetical protein
MMEEKEENQDLKSRLNEQLDLERLSKSGLGRNLSQLLNQHKLPKHQPTKSLPDSAPL